MIFINTTTNFTKSKTKNKTLENINSFFISGLIIIIMILILLDPVTYSKSVINGLTLFFQNVLPGLLPFMFLVKTLTNQGTIIKLTKPLKKTSFKLFGTNEYGFYALIMSMISGYPIGAKITSDLYAQNKLKKENLLKTAILSSTPGLIFVIGSVGGLMLKNIRLGFYIYLINIVACLIASLIINFFSKKQSLIKNERSLTFNSKQTLGCLTQDTTISLLSVAFYIALSTLIIDLLTNLKMFSFIANLFGLTSEKTALLEGIMSGIVEMTNGVKKLSKAITPLSLSFISAIISFSGFSILFQSFSFLSQTNINYAWFILGKFFQSIISFILSLLFFSL